MRFARLVILSLTLLFLLAGCKSREPEAVKDPLEPYRENAQNVILIAVDTLAARNLHFMGYERETSPFMDELCDSSVVFDRAYATKALTLPSFTSIFSGLHPVSHGVDENGIVIPDELHRLTEDFQAAGFYTAGFIGANIIGTSYGMHKGFDTYADVVSHHIPASKVIEKVGQFLSGSSTTPDNPAGWKPDSQPLFMFVHFFDTHTDYNPLQKYLNQWADFDYDGPVTGQINVFSDYNHNLIELDEDDLQRTRDLYDAEIRSFDDHMRELFSLLESSGLMDNSLVIVTADHGENLGEHHYITHGHPYEAGLHIPLMFHFPGDVGAGTHITGMVENIDVLPTAMSLVGIHAPEYLDGIDLMPAIISPQDFTTIKPVLFAFGGINSRQEKTYGLFNGRYRIVKNIRWSDEPVLWDISVDPNEEADIADQEPEVVEAMLEVIDMMAAGDKPYEPIEYDPETREMLESLGYIN
jgi:arylsulfatase A-like enzyme